MSTPCDIHKRREIEFHPTPPRQVERALAFLGQLPRLETRRLGERRIEIAYCVSDYTLEAIETALTEIGCHLEATLLIRLKRALYYYIEDVQRDNIEHPGIPTKNYTLPHVEAWDKRLHGDHDDTPNEWRQYK